MIDFDLKHYLDKEVTISVVTGAIFLGTVTRVSMNSFSIRSSTGDFDHRIALDKVVSVTVPLEKKQE